MNKYSIFLLYCLSVILVMTNAIAIDQIEEYIKNRNSKEVTEYMNGYIDAIANNIYLFGGCEHDGRSYISYDTYKKELNFKIEKAISDGEILAHKDINNMLIDIVTDDLSCSSDDAIKLKNLHDKKYIMKVKEISEKNLSSIVVVRHAANIQDKPDPESAHHSKKSKSAKHKQRKQGKKTNNK